MSLVLTALVLATLLLALPTTVFAIQVFSARASVPSPSPSAPERPRTAVLVPAHNEATGIVETLRALRAQLRPGDRLVVVADNCSDMTGKVAQAEGAEVLVRTNTNLCGKGYALDFGVRHLAHDPPQVLVIVDADCVTHPGAIDALAAECAAFNQPVQSLYLMEAPGASLGLRMAEFAWRVRNQVRPLGWKRCGGPCQLMGSGMAFPWAVINDAPLATGDLVEDMQLGVDLALRDHLPRFAPIARVTSRFPNTDVAARIQRTRWEHGHINTLLTAVPRLLKAGLEQRRWMLFGMALDLMVPPLALLTLLVAGTGILNLAVAGMLMGNWLLPSLSAATLLLLAVSVAIAWSRFGRDIVSLRELLSVPWYVLSKLSIYISFVRRRQTTWVRAKRDRE